MVALTIQLIGADKLGKGLARASSKTLPVNLQKAMTVSCLLVEGDARRGAKRDTGRLQNSITHHITGNASSSLVGKVGPSVAYGLYVERGRRPGRPPPVSALAGWARRHGISPYLVARAIGRRGVKAAPFLLPAYEKNRARILSLFGQVCDVTVQDAAG